MDPLNPSNIVPELHSLIFQHFRGNEVKKLSLVSPSWYVNFGESKVCMKKLKFRNRRNPSSIFLSQRNYQYVGIKMKMLRVLLQKRPKMRNSIKGLKLYQDSESPQQQLPVLLPNLEELNLGDACWADAKAITEDNDMGKLKKLLINEQPTMVSFRDDLLYKCTNLKTLRVGMFAALALYSKAVTDYPFKLERLSVHYYMVAPSEYTEPMMTFIGCHKDTLKFMEIIGKNECPVDHLMISLLNHSFASELVVEPQPVVNPQPPEAPIDYGYHLIRESDMKKLMLAVPNLQELSVVSQVVCIANIRAIAGNALKLRKIKADMENVTKIRLLYNSLEQPMNQNIAIEPIRMM